MLKRGRQDDERASLGDLGVGKILLDENPRLHVALQEQSDQAGVLVT
jgi:hypothetical protein